MTIVVLKFGGSSLASTAHIRHVTQLIQQKITEHDQVIVVLSAMGDHTNRLLDQAHALTHQPHPRELDALLATGEMVSVSMLAMALQSLGIPARSLNAAQAGIHLDGEVPKLWPQNKTHPVQACLEQGFVPIVTGFQALDAQGDFVTLGRGSSDLTAVYLAAQCQADECLIYTDVDGVYTSDPKIVPHARLIPSLSYADMLELSELGAKVLQAPAVAFAAQHAVALRVLSTFHQNSGTLIQAQQTHQVSGITYQRYHCHAQISPVLDAQTKSLLAPILTSADDFSTNDLHTDLAIRQKDFNHLSRELPESYTLTDQGALVKICIVGWRKKHSCQQQILLMLDKQRIPVEALIPYEKHLKLYCREKYFEIALRLLHELFFECGELD